MKPEPWFFRALAVIGGLALFDILTQYLTALAAAAGNDPLGGVNILLGFLRLASPLVLVVTVLGAGVIGWAQGRPAPHAGLGLVSALLAAALLGGSLMLADRAWPIAALGPVGNAEALGRTVRSALIGALAAAAWLLMIAGWLGREWVALRRIGD